jgi:hypothetical protein
MINGVPEQGECCGKCVGGRIFGKDTNISKLHARENEEQIKFRDHLLTITYTIFCFISVI